MKNNGLIPDGGLWTNSGTGNRYRHGYAQLPIHSLLERSHAQVIPSSWYIVESYIEIGQTWSNMFKHGQTLGTHAWYWKIRDMMTIFGCKGLEFWPILISFPFVSTSWFWLSGQWKGHSLVASSEPIFSTSQYVKSKSQTSTGSCCKTNPNPPTALEHWKNNKPRSGHKEQVTRRTESFPVLCIALSGPHQFLALAHRLQHGAW
jgi:hypothetical protein